MHCACMSHELSRAACLQCTTACVVYASSVVMWLMECAKRGRDVHWGKVPLHPS